MKTSDTEVMGWIQRQRMVFCLLPILFGISGHSALVGVPERWDSGSPAGWINYDAVNEQPGTLMVENSSLKITFQKQSVKSPPEEYIFNAGTNASQGSFSGDYVSSGVTGICFRLFCDRQVAVSALLYNSDSKRLWRYRVPDVRTGQWMTVQVPLTPMGMEKVLEGNEWGALDRDLRNVAWTGVSIERNSSMNQQVYRLDDFVLQGVPEFGAWMAQFSNPAGYGVGTCVSLSGGDLDGDGACNYDEWTAGTSAGDGSNNFRIALSFVRGGEDASGYGVILKWPSAPDRKYSIWRSTNLAEGFVKLGNGEIDATPPENCLLDASAASSGPCFYRAEVRREEP